MRLLLFSFLAALGISLLIMPYLIRRLLRSRIMDIPNRRSSHSIPVPRGGGLVIIGPALVGIVIFALAGPLTWGALSSGALFNDFTQALLVGVIVLGTIGLLDDIYSLQAALRLLIQILLIGVCLIHADLGLRDLTIPGLGTWYPDASLGEGAGLMVSLVLVVGFTNMFNFMDGINGLAGFQALIGTGSLAGLGYLTGNMTLALPMTLLAGGSLGFLRFNFPRARVFMGDVGSLPLGYALSLGALQAHRHAPAELPLWLPLMFVWPCLFDATYTLLNRILHGRNPIRAHRSHSYQRLVIHGWSHTRVTGLYLVGMIACAVCAFSCFLSGNLGGRYGLSLFWSVFVVSLLISILISNRIRAVKTEAT